MEMQSYKRLTPAAQISKRGGIWEFSCECGNRVVAAKKDVISGKKGSCGCLKKESISARNSRSGKYTDLPNYKPLYSVWQGMKNRCLNKEAENYRHYGGRGVTIQTDWLDFRVFYEDTYETYVSHCGQYGRRNTFLERIDNASGYSASNCRWATRVEQMNNTRKNRFVLVGKTKLTIAQLARKYSLSPTLLYDRIVTLGWSPERAIIPR